jgi:hypothetical protein
VAVVGAECDAIATTELMGDDDEERVAWLIGYFGYPCDAAYIAASIEVAGIALSQEEALPLIESGAVLEHPAMRRAVLTWAHAIPTRETVLLMMVCTYLDDGSVEWEHVEMTGAAGGGIDFLDRFEAAAHEYEAYPISDRDHEMRTAAIGLIQGVNGETFDAHMHPAGSLLVAARAWAKR